DHPAGDGSAAGLCGCRGDRHRRNDREARHGAGGDATDGTMELVAAHARDASSRQTPARTCPRTRPGRRSRCTMRSPTVTPARSKSVLITGASSGLGRAAPVRLAELGYRVFAGVRTDSSSATLAAVPPSRGELIPVMLDVTDATSISQAGSHLEQACVDTGLWGVV